jgi:putative effector of murein hydrolase
LRTKPCCARSNCRCRGRSSAWCSCARGFAAGLAAHGIGTARAFQVNALAGTFAGVALGLNGLLTAILVPLLLPWLLK